MIKDKIIKIWRKIMSLFVGKSNDGRSFVHITKDTVDQESISSGYNVASTIINTITDQYIQYKIYVCTDYSVSYQSVSNTYRISLDTTGTNMFNSYLMSSSSSTYPYIAIINNKLNFMPTYKNDPYYSNITLGPAMQADFNEGYNLSSIEYPTSVVFIFFNIIINTSGQISTAQFYQNTYTNETLFTKDNIKISGMEYKNMKLIARSKLNENDLWFNTTTKETLDDIFQLINYNQNTNSPSVSIDVEKIQFKYGDKLVFDSSKNLLLWKNGYTNAASKYFNNIASGDYAYYGYQQTVKIYDIPSNVSEFLIVYHPDSISQVTPVTYLMNSDFTYAYPFHVAANTTHVYNNLYIVKSGSSVYTWNNPPTSVFNSAIGSYQSGGGSGGLLGGVNVRGIHTMNGYYCFVPLTFKN